MHRIVLMVAALKEQSAVLKALIGKMPEPSA